MIERRLETAPACAPRSAPAARHVAIIMDGNRRWAAERQLPVADGHRAGGRALRRTCRAARNAGLDFLTVYAFSQENQRRDGREVDALMQTIRAFAEDEAASIVREGLRVRAIGRLEGLPPATRDAIAGLCAVTERNDGLTLTLALNYSARTEIAHGIRRIAEDVAAGRVDARAIDDALLERYLRTPELPDPDLLIRTGGELRLSNFLLYELAYTELWATPVLWPAFDAGHFERALAEFATRQRRFGS